MAPILTTQKASCFFLLPPPPFDKVSGETWTMSERCFTWKESLKVVGVGGWLVSVPASLTAC